MAASKPGLYHVQLRARAGRGSIGVGELVRFFCGAGLIPQGVAEDGGTGGQEGEDRGDAAHGGPGGAETTTRVPRSSSQLPAVP